MKFNQSSREYLVKFRNNSIRLKKVFPIFQHLLLEKAQVVRLVKIKIIDTEPLLITYFNQHAFNIWWNDKKYQKLIENNFLYYVDGVGLRMAAKLFGKNVMVKFNASEINEKLFLFLKKENIPVIIIGGRFSQQLIENSSLNLKKYFNGFEDVQKKNQLFNQIDETKIKTIIIGMGIPKQEKIAFELSQKIPNLQIICVGNFLEFYFGTILRAPSLLHNSGFEWLFRVLSEPRRLWRRYFIGIPIFIYRIIKLKVASYAK